LGYLETYRYLIEGLLFFLRKSKKKNLLRCWYFIWIWRSLLVCN
jgi:hypothetical protein